MQFPNVYISTGMWADCIVKRCCMGTYKKRARMCERSEKNSVFVTSSHWLQWWYTLLRYPHIQYALIPDEPSLFSLHFCNALFVYTRKTKGEKCRKCRKRRDLHIKHAAKSTIALVEELKARWTQVEPSQSGKPHFVKTHRHKQIHPQEWRDTNCERGHIMIAEVQKVQKVLHWYSMTS